MIRPYQAEFLGINFVRGLDFHGVPSRYAKGLARYVNNSRQVYAKHLAGLASQINESVAGASVTRIQNIFDHILIDEVQDMAGHDLTMLNLLFESDLRTTLVGDPRQVTYHTTNEPKYSQYRDGAIVDWFRAVQKRGFLEIEERNVSYRCRQEICDEADKLYAEFNATVSANAISTGHDGVFAVHPDHVDHYILQYSPKVLRWDSSTPTASVNAINMGDSKGSTEDRVLIYPTKTMEKYFDSQASMANITRAKLYVAMTRGRFSVAFATPSKSGLGFSQWTPRTQFPL